MTFALVPGVSVADTENGTVLLDERSGRYWMLNRTGAVVLRCLLDGESPRRPPGHCCGATPTRPSGPLPTWRACSTPCVRPR